ncbi:MAG: hypothetical protein FD181_1444 [Prolixibacteraceae bacterium]|nr:MAG: hypothetical protein FD181_1444 [Prolixibacteraceae bacterium]
MKKIVEQVCSFYYGHRKKLLMMRNAVLIILISAFQVLATGSYSQTAQLSLKMKDATIKNVLIEIENQSEFYFLYNSELIDVTRKVDISANKEKVNDILSRLFSDDEVNISITDRHIVLTPVAEKSSQQQNSVSGKVTDSSNLPLPGVTVVVMGTTAGSVTNADGRYTLANITENAILQFSFIGMQTQEIPVKSQSLINVILRAENVELDEIVAIGYGTESTKRVSGSISKVSEKDFNKGVNRNAADMLQGKVAGLTITQDGGDITSSQTIRLRGTSSLTGSSSPFVVIDGIPGLDMWSIAPDDIESISVLKDASATAIYGSRSASGVILITTKKGKGGQTNIQYNGYLATSFGANYPEVLNATQWRDYAAENNLDTSGLDKGADTDWFNEIMRTGISQNHNVSISGGIKNGSYRASMNYQDLQGIMKDNYMQRLNGLFSLTQKGLNDKLTLSLNAGMVINDYQPTNTSNTLLAYNMLPVYPVKNPDGTYFDIFEFDMGNPVNNIENNYNLHKNSLAYGNMKVDIEILKGLVAGVNLFKQRETDDYSSYAASTTQAGRNDNGRASRGNTVWDKELFEATIDYKKSFDKHYINVLGGYSWEENVYQSVGASNRNFINDMFGANNLAIGEDLRPTDVSSYKSSNKLISFFGRANYSFDNKYIVTATVRQDGSSKFGENHKWGLFPSASVAWRISDESFMENADVVSDLKFRVGYGVVGNQDGIGSYNSLALYRRGDEYFDNGKWHNSFVYAQNHNPDLKWEETSSFNPGIDFGLYNNRITGSIDYYMKKTTDLLFVYSVPVPPFLYSSMLANVGDMSNNGIEFLINAVIVKRPDFNWSASVNFAHNKNTIDRLSNDIYQTERIYTGPVNLRGSGYLTSSVIEEGQEVGTFYNLKFKELDADGKWVIEDIEPDEQITPADYTYIGHANPDFTYGIVNNFNYKRFDLSFFLRGMYGNDILNTPRIQYANEKWLPGINVMDEALTNGVKDDPLLSSYFIESGSFLRLDNASLAYNFDVNKIKGFNKLRVYVTGQNLFTITKFTGPDPEVNMSGLSPGVTDQYYVPKPKTVSFGVELSF